MEKIPFTVSSRTARLIGRENVASTNSAVMELVKNAYDADAEEVFLIFDIPYAEVPERLSEAEFTLLLEMSQEVKSFYKKVKNDYELKKLKKEELESAELFFKGLGTIYLVDNGEGMSKPIIKKNWMNIGTDNKELNLYSSKKKRVKTGAKGIGRFALDRIGEKCSMETFVEDAKKGLSWTVNWSDFEKKNKTIDQIYARLDEVNERSGNSLLSNLLKNHRSEENGYLSVVKKFQEKGTILKIAGLRDFWTYKKISEVFKNLRTLIPPKSQTAFQPYLFSLSHETSFGEIDSVVCEEYDYRLTVDYKGKDTISIIVDRNEFDVESLEKAGVFKEISSFKKYPFRKQDFKNRKIEYKLPIKDVFIKDSFDLNKIKMLGSFNADIFFMKKSYSRDDQLKFHYRHFNKTDRKGWLDQFGGIKLFRDNFRVRPYGEPKQSAFDWTYLGNRALQSPAAASHEKGLWRVRPNQISGSIFISRLMNTKLQDQSNREGVQSVDDLNEFIDIFHVLLEFLEKDRQLVSRNLKNYWEKKNENELKLAKAKKLIEEEKERIEKNKNKKKEELPTEEDARIKLLIEASEIKDEKIKEAEYEKKVLYNLASLGITLSSYVHELSQLRDQSQLRIGILKDQLRDFIDVEKEKTLDDSDNPFITVKDLFDNSIQTKGWLDFALQSMKKDRRKAKNVDLLDYLTKVIRLWKPLLEPQQVSVELINECGEEVNLKRKMFKIDLDSIFNNLITNSIYALNSSQSNVDKKLIKITLFEKNNKVAIRYTDNGPGLDSSIKEPNEILQQGFSTKGDDDDSIGSGLGMWIANDIVLGYGGKLDIKIPKLGFRVDIII